MRWDITLTLCPVPPHAIGDSKSHGQETYSRDFSMQWDRKSLAIEAADQNTTREHQLENSTLTVDAHPNPSSGPEVSRCPSRDGRDETLPDVLQQGSRSGTDGTKSNESIRAQNEQCSSLRHNDVVFGRGKTFDEHPGNKNYRALLAKYWMEYVNTETIPGRKDEICDVIKREVIEGTDHCAKGPRGRFVKFQKNGTLEELTTKDVNERIKQALRDRERVEKKKGNGSRNEANSSYKASGGEMEAMNKKRNTYRGTFMSNSSGSSSEPPQQSSPHLPLGDQEGDIIIKIVREDIDGDLSATVFLPIRERRISLFDLLKKVKKGSGVLQKSHAAEKTEPKMIFRHGSNEHSFCSEDMKELTVERFQHAFRLGTSFSFSLLLVEPVATDTFLD